MCDKVLRRHGHGDRRVFRCYQCELALKRRSRQRHLQRLTSRLLRCDAESVSDCLTAMRRSWGGIERLLAGMPEEQRAALMVKLTLTVDDLNQRASKAALRESAAVAEARGNPGLIAAAAAVLTDAGWRVEPPV